MAITKQRFFKAGYVKTQQTVHLLLVQKMLQNNR